MTKQYPSYPKSLLRILRIAFCHLRARNFRSPGADEWSIYTKDELRVLIANNRAKPFLPYELCKLHQIKRTFHGRIAR